MKPLHFIRAAVVAVGIALAGHALAIDTERDFADPVLQERYEGVIKELRCLVCQNETIADSNATLAVDLRREVHEMIAAGKSEQEIKDFMLARYGDFVLYKPRLSGKNLVLWAAPALMLLFGVFAAVRFIRKRAEEADIATETDKAGPEAGQS
ncbi:MAG TPA: cytochrome c-type biogenesis protein [Steroidobacteraceae bacterium]